MADPYFNPDSLYPDFQKAFESDMSSSGSVLNDCPQQSGVAFGLQVQQTAPNNHLNTLIPYGESFRKPFSDSRFKKVPEPERVIYCQEPEQSEPLDLSDKTKAQQQTDENSQFHTSQSELRIDRVWSMDGEASSQSHSIHANHPPLTSTFKDTAGNSFLGIGQSTPQISSVVDNNLHQTVEISSQGRIDTFSKPAAPTAIITPQLNSEQLQRNSSSAIQAEEVIDNRSSLEERKRERKRERQRKRYQTDLAYAERKRERQKELRKNPAYAERQRERKRERYQTDPAYAERQRKRKRERTRERYQTDPAYAERQRERKRKLRKDPAYAERERERQRELRKDPAYAERQRERKRERYQTDPAYAERQRERKRKLRKDPAYAERERERERERKRELRKDPAYAERQRERKRERYQTDPAYAEGQKIYQVTYKRIKRQTSNKEEAKKQAVIARDQYLQSVNSARNSGELPLTFNLVETTQSFSKKLDGTPPPFFCRQAEGVFTVPIEPISP